MGNVPDEPDEPRAGLEGFLLWILVIATGLLAWGIAYVAVSAAFGKTPGHIAGLAALILTSVVWVRWGPELPDIPD